jgi:hypothetical protein
MRHSAFLHQSGEKPCEIKLLEAILIPPFPGSNPGAPAIDLIKQHDFSWRPVCSRARHSETHPAVRSEILFPARSPAGAHAACGSLRGLAPSFVSRSLHMPDFREPTPIREAPTPRVRCYASFSTTRAPRRERHAAEYPQSELSLRRNRSSTGIQGVRSSAVKAGVTCHPGPDRDDSRDER